MTPHRRRRGGEPEGPSSFWPQPPPLRPTDADQAITASQLQRAHPSWLVLWSPYRRAFTAFACFTDEPVVLDASAPQQLHLVMQRTEQQHASRTARPVDPAAAGP
jgi:hypothetical protein